MFVVIVCPEASCVRSAVRLLAPLLGASVSFSVVPSSGILGAAAPEDTGILDSDILVVVDNFTRKGDGIFTSSLRLLAVHVRPPLQLILSLNTNISEKSTMATASFR